MQTITLALVLTLATLMPACSKTDSGGAGASSSTGSSNAATPATPATPPPATPATTQAKLPSSVNAAPADIKPVKQDIGTAPVHITLKSAKTDHDGYIMTFEVQNKGPKEIQSLFYYGCTYDKMNKKVGPAPSNGLTISVKPNAKADGEVYLGKQSDSPAAATLAVNSIKYADGTTWEDKMLMGCPDSVKP